LPAEKYVSLKIYNTLGQEVKTLVNQSESAGSYKVIWDGKNNSGHAVPSGIDLYRLQAGSFTKTMKMLLVK
jgi:flagellar hook assembly protein FlgD